jgi:hypothetical protein
MLDQDTFLTTVYVLADAFCQTLDPPLVHPGPETALTRSEVLTLAVFSQWEHFPSERAFYRYAERHLRPYFPTLPDRTQFNRLLRRSTDLLERFALSLADQVLASPPTYEILDCTAAPVRNVRRRGRGWLAGLADIGWSTRLGWYYGFHLLLAVTPDGVITGFGVGPASANDRELTETLLAVRQHPHPRLPSVGAAAVNQTYLADTGFAGRTCEAHWQQAYGSVVVCAPQRDSHRRWSAPVRRWAAGHRQLIESVFFRVLQSYRLERDRPHTLDGFQARLAAKVALHNVCGWCNQQYGRGILRIADFLDW